METPTFTVFGSHGSLTVNADTGEVLELVHETDEERGYKNIRRFDVVEWRATYPNEKLEGMQVDILDLGLWEVVDDDNTEKYFEPDHEWRNIYLEISQKK